MADALEQDPDQVDDDRAVANRRLDGGRMTKIGLDRVNLADAAERLQLEGKVGAAHGGADAIAVPRKRPHHVAADKTGSAEDRD